jgi:anti-sigma-K factor RskA
LATQPRQCYDVGPTMTDRDETPHTETCGGADVAPYALGALTPQEAATFEVHLATCAVCAAELASFQHVIDAMSVTAEIQHAPRALRRRVMRAVNQEARAEQPRRAGMSEFLRNATARPAMAAGGLLAAGAIAFGVVELAGPSTHTRVYQAQVTGPGSAQLRLSGVHAELAVQHFATLPKGRTYEVWLERGKHAPVPANALFKVTAGGDGSVQLPVELQRGDLIMVTSEPAGGRLHPSTTPIMRVKLT